MTSGEPMTGVLIGVAMVVALAVLWLVFEGLKSRQKKETLESQMNELRRDLQSVATAQAKSTGQMEAIATGVAQRLDSVTPALQEAVKNSAQITEGILGGAKSRGSLGEITLERLLEDSLPPRLYAIQYRFSSGEAVDAVIFLRDKKLMAIDSKFPLDAYRRIASEGDAESS